MRPKTAASNLAVGISVTTAPESAMSWALPATAAQDGFTSRASARTFSPPGMMTSSAFSHPTYAM
jgi:hypothetical protein